MKYVITESRLNEFIYEYLESFLERHEVFHTRNFISVVENADFEDDKTYMEFDYSDGRLWINRELMNNLESLFFQNINETATFVKKWFEKKFKVKVKFIQT